MATERRIDVNESACVAGGWTQAPTLEVRTTTNVPKNIAMYCF